MLERTRFVLAFQEGAYSVTELCQRFSISRQTAYKWLDRFQAHGLDGLSDLSRAPKSCPHCMSAPVEEVLLQARRQHPTWGPRTILNRLRKTHPQLELPSASSVGELFKRKGLIEPRHRRRKWKHPGGSHIKTQAPNDVWTADFKGHFLLHNGQYCYPLTVCDGHSRYLLACDALDSVRQEGAFPVFERLFRELGLPEAIRTDNGVPFATQALCGLSQLNVYWIKLGIAHQRIAPGRPEQNGRHERMHRTLKAEATRPPEKDLPRQQVRFDSFRAEFNEVRPHQALAGETPASQYTTSPRPMPDVVPEPDYPGHMEVRQVSNAGTFRFKSHLLFISQALVKEQIALEEVEDGLWSVYFYDVLLARLDERDFRLRA